MDTNQYEPGLSFNQYRNIGRDSELLTVNASILKQPTALEMWSAMQPDEEGESTLALSRGDALHKAVLEPKAFNEEFDDFYLMSPTKGINTKAAQEARLLNPDKILYNDDILVDVEGMQKAIERHALAMDMLNNCDHKELSGVAYDKEFNIVRKIRVDAAPGIGNDRGNYLVDIKSCQSIRFFDFRRSILKFGYHLAAAYYIDTDAMITGQPPRENFYFIGVQSVKPFMARVYALLPEDIEKGRELYKERLGILTQAVSDNQYCAYEHESDPIPIPLTFGE